ncbi:alpha/beta family hydrolase [Actinomycetes bacterium M1A6_2h]
MEPFEAEGVVGSVDRPTGAVRAAVLLAHGAGGNRESKILLSVSDALTARGLMVARIDLPFRQRRPKGPPSPSGAAGDRAGIVAAAAALKSLAADVPLVIGGQSYGGRQASMVVAEASDGEAVADGLLLLSYPLHPPGKPEKIRTEHFPHIRIPVVFVHGSSDPFASDDELAQAVTLVPSSVHVVNIAGAGHDLAPAKKPTGTLTADAVADYLL